jgi:hypothetical protein
MSPRLDDAIEMALLGPSSKRRRVPNLTFLTGFEHQRIVNSGGSPGELFSGAGASGGYSIATASPIDGAADCRIDVTNGTSGNWISRNAAGVTTFMAQRFSFYFEQHPNPVVNSECIVATFNLGDGNDCHLGFSVAGGLNQFGLRFPDSGQIELGPAIAEGVEVVLEFSIDVSANPRVARARLTVAGVTYTTELTEVRAPTTVLNTWIGTNHNNEDYIGHWDNWAITETPADWPLRPGVVQRLLPGSDGVHSPAVADCVTNQAGAGIDTVAAYALIDDVPFPALATFAEGWTQGVAHDSHYGEVNFQDLAQPGRVNGVRALAAVSAAASTPNAGALYVVRNDATEHAIFGSPAARADWGVGTTHIYKGAMVPAPQRGWDKAKVDALKLRFGHFNDVLPLPRFHAAMLEVDVPV